MFFYFYCGTVAVGYGHVLVYVQCLIDVIERCFCFYGEGAPLVVVVH